MPPRPEPPGDADARTLFEALLDRGGRHLFRLRNGKPFEGWVLEVGDEAVLVTSAGPLSSDEPYPMAFDAVDLTSLAYVDEEGRVIPLSSADPTPD